jgi:hypothetical protein
MADGQNTIAGTTGGNPIIPTNGNSWLEGLSGLADVGAKFADLYNSFGGSKETAKAEAEQDVTPPMQTTPEPKSAADFFSDPSRVQKAAIYALMGTFVLGAVVIIAKRA